VVSSSDLRRLRVVGPCTWVDWLTTIRESVCSVLFMMRGRAGVVSLVAEVLVEQRSLTSEFVVVHGAVVVKVLPARVSAMSVGGLSFCNPTFTAVLNQ
jgi:hypothetical protein